MVKEVVSLLCVLLCSTLLYGTEKSRLDYCVQMKLEGKPQQPAVVKACDRVILDHIRATQGNAVANHLQQLKSQKK